MCFFSVEPMWSARDAEDAGTAKRRRKRRLRQFLRYEWLTVAMLLGDTNHLDAPVAQMVEQLPDIMHFFDALTPVPEQVIEVPKILLDDVPVRTAVRHTQLAEQLVEVPTIVPFSSLQRIVEQTVDNPVPGRGGRIAGLQGFLSGHSSTASGAEQIVDLPVGGGLQGFLPRQISLQRTVKQLVDIPAGGGPQLPDPDASSSSAVSRDERGEGFFSHFSQKEKKC